MAEVVIVGSGASAVHFALSVLRKGYRVVMVDVGRKKPSVGNPSDRFVDLKHNLRDPVAYFLGESFQSVVFPDTKGEYYGFPPSKDYVFEGTNGMRVETDGFTPLLSYAQGGLAEAWTGGVYAFRDEELTDFPFDYKDISGCYDEVARRIGITGLEDDLAKFIPLHDGLLEPLALDDHSATLLAEYNKRRRTLIKNEKCYLGYARVAVLSSSREAREECSYLGRCLWGCPRQAFYTPSITLDECRRFPRFEYCGGMEAIRFEFSSEGKVTRLIVKRLDDGSKVKLPVDRLVLAAGTINSTMIFLRSIFHRTGEIVKLSGFMDNRQIFVPFVNLKLLGKEAKSDAYQYHQLALGLESADPKEYIHGLITTLTTALVHPLLQKLPMDSKSSIRLFRYVHAALGLVNINFSDYRREDNYITFEPSVRDQEPTMVIKYSPANGEDERIKSAIRRIRRALWRLRCVVPPRMVHVRPMGASVHYAGTLPMSRIKQRFTTSQYCQSNDFTNLYIVDGTTFPFLPAKNLTFTLMANAVRVAEAVF